MKKLALLWTAVLIGFVAVAHADFQWQIPGGIGTLNVPTGASDVLPVVGYDAIQKSMIYGGAASLMTLWKEIDGYGGVVGNTNTGGPYVQPYLALGSDFARYVPALRQVQNLEVHAFVRYVPTGDNNKNIGAGGAIAYKFGGPKPISPQAPSQPPAPPATLPVQPVAQ